MPERLSDERLAELIADYEGSCGGCYLGCSCDTVSAYRELQERRAAEARADREPLCYPCFRDLNVQEGKSPCADRDDAYNACCNACGMELGA